MKDSQLSLFFLGFFFSAASVTCEEISNPDPAKLVQDAFNYLRGKYSVSVVDMTIHRPFWERKVSIKAWTKGEKESLFTIFPPAKDKGNGTLKKGEKMWIYNPRINRVIKLPPFMMSQAWMGSDFSNNYLAKSDTLYTVSGGDKNCYGFLEFYYSGVGSHEYTRIYFDPDIYERMAAGDIHSMGSKYLSAHMNIELHPFSMHI